MVDVIYNERTYNYNPSIDPLSYEVHYRHVPHSEITVSLNVHSLNFEVLTE